MNAEEKQALVDVFVSLGLALSSTLTHALESRRYVAPEMSEEDMQSLAILQNNVKELWTDFANNFTYWIDLTDGSSR